MPEHTDPRAPATGGHHVTRYSETTLPTVHGEFRVVVYRADDGTEHVALAHGVLDGTEGVLCRVHSECVTSEVFGSTKCDCKLQLDLALEHVQRASAGVVLYMRQEGRGIGLGNKIAAYALQEQGHDTVDANRLLGLPDDARNYNPAAEMLEDLGVKSITLMTNNPLKVEGLREAGINVQKRVPHVTQAPPEAVNYLEVKRDRMGHMIDEELESIDRATSKATYDAATGVALAG